MDGKGIVILGAGPEIDFIVRNISDTKVPLLGYGPFSADEEKSDLHRYCSEKGIALIKDHLEAVELKPCFVLMLSYAPLIPKATLNQCKFVNLHGALLPRYRGMHGGTWALINGEKKAGYTMHLVDEGIDSGPIYFQNSVDVELNDDINIVRAKILGELKKNILAQLEVVYLNRVVPTPQDDSQAIYVCKRHPEDSRIDWNWSSKRIHDFIRALAPPYTEGAFTVFQDATLFLVESEYLDLPIYSGIPGQVVNVYDDGAVLIKTGDSAIRIRRTVWKGELVNPSAIIARVGMRLCAY